MSESRFRVFLVYNYFTKFPRYRLFFNPRSTLPESGISAKGFYSQL